jgi:lipoate-protein ligase A
MISDVKERVTSIQDILGRPVDVEELREALTRGFADALQIELVRGKLSKEEQQTAEKLAKEKYSTVDWNFSR